MILDMAIAVFSKCWRGQRVLPRRRENLGRDHAALASDRTAPIYNNMKNGYTNPST
jgi:hypothetical protein